MRIRFDRLKIEYAVFGLVLLAATIIRIYNLPKLIVFAGDQGIDLINVWQMIEEKKVSLLGPKTSLGEVYNGPLYYYLAAIALIAGKGEPLTVSYMMIGYWIMSFVVIYYLARRIGGYRGAGLVGVSLFAFWPRGIEYSRVAFSSFPTPLFASLYLTFIYEFTRRKKDFLMLLAGLMAGLMLQLHYANMVMALAVLVWVGIKKKEDVLKGIVWWFIGLGIGAAPMILFELRHSFFNSKMAWEYIRGEKRHNGRMQWHYLISFYPVAAMVIDRLWNKLWRIKREAAFLVLIFLFFLEIRGWQLDRTNGFTMPSGWNYLQVKEAVGIIEEAVTKGKINSFNVASIIDGDTRAHPFRYLLLKDNFKPEAVEAYGVTENLFVVARCNDDVASYPVWEIEAMGKKRINQVSAISSNYCVYHFSRLEAIQD